MRALPITGPASYLTASATSRSPTRPLSRKARGFLLGRRRRRHRRDGDRTARSTDRRAPRTAEHDTKSEATESTTDRQSEEPRARSPPAPTPASDGRRGHLVVFDTTLRDGEQSPGISLDAAEKLEIAEQLARVGRRLHRGRVPGGQPGRLRGRPGHRPLGRQRTDARPSAGCRAPSSPTSTAAGRRCATPTGPASTSSSRRAPSTWSTCSR